MLVYFILMYRQKCMKESIRVAKNDAMIYDMLVNSFGYLEFTSRHLVLFMLFSVMRGFRMGTR